jgi:AcrR family transcriptional regulator
MADAVKGKRTYDSPRRRAQAAATRREILEAAERLFEQDGYAATTIAAIAAEANVALKTVYVNFDTKSGVLRALWNLRLRGDEGDAPVPERPWFQEVVDEPDPVRQLRLTARYSREVKVRVGSLFEVIRGAAVVDPDIAALWERIQREFHATQRTIVESLETKNALRSGLSVDRAADILWTLNHPNVWQLLVHERDWTPEEHERWWGDIAAIQLLEPAIPTSPSRGNRSRRTTSSR